MNASFDHPYDLWINAIRSKLKSRKLMEIVELLEIHEPKRTGEREITTRAVFRELKEALKCGESVGENLLFQMNTPLPEHDVDSRHSGWADMSHDIFNLDPELSSGFASQLLSRCVTTPTNLVFCLSHSDAIAYLVKNNIKSVDFSECKAVIPKIEDSRTVYALKALRWYPIWSEIKNSIFETLFSKQPVIRNEAYWTLQARANARDAKDWLADRGIQLSPEAEKNSEINGGLTKEIWSQLWRATELA